MNHGATLVAYAAAAILAWFAYALRKPAEVPYARLNRATVIQSQAQDAAQAQYEEHQKRERESLDEFRRTSPYRQTRTISVDTSSGKILGFCTLGAGRLALLTGAASPYGAARAKGDDAVESRLVWLAADGQEERAVPLDFVPRSVTTAPDGSLWVAGDASIAHLSATGEILATAESPHFTLEPEGQEEFLAEAKARHELLLKQMADSLQQQTDTVAELEQKQEGEPGFAPPERLAILKEGCQSIKQSVETMSSMTDEKILENELARLRQIHRIAATADNVFLVAQQPTGYGYSVWRCGSDLSSPVRIVEGLAGCCGQMDIQAVDGGLAIAENSRHHVRLVDIEGEEIRTFGGRSEADITTGFGGCCNPMNTCLDNTGCLLTSESNGLVKRYSLDGEMQEVVGVADVEAGCKNSSIGLSADGSSLYYLDIHKGTVVVLEKAG